MAPHYSPTRGYNADRNEDGSPIDPRDSCETCGDRGYYDAICTDDGGQLLLCDGCIDLHRALEAACTVCGSGKKTVVSDRLWLNTPVAVCCGEVA